MSGFLPYGKQTIEDEDVAAVAEALRGDFLTTGPTVEAFETAFAQGLLTRVTGDIIALSPPLILEESHIDRMVETLRKVLAKVD